MPPQTYVAPVNGWFATTGTTASSNQLYVNPNMTAFPLPVAPPDPPRDPLDWLRDRVEEICALVPA